MSIRSDIRSHPVFSCRHRVVGLIVAGTLLATSSLASGPASDPASASLPHDVVSVIDRSDIQMSGFTTLEELLESRTAFNFLGLHVLGFGSGSLGILINGRDVSGLDYSTLPLIAVERIELLHRGAIQAGGQPLGALNVVLRKVHDGTEVALGASRPAEPGRDSNVASALWGGALGSGHMTIGFGHTGQEEIRDADREFSRAQWTPGGAFADAENISLSGNTLVYVPAGASAPAVVSLGQCEGDHYTGSLTHPAGEVCGYDFVATKWVDGYERRTRESIFLNAEHPLAENARLYAEARAAQGDSLFRYAPAVGTIDFTAANPTLRSNMINNGGLDDASFPQPNEAGEFRLYHRFVGHGNREWRTDLKEHDLTLGIHGQIEPDLDYDANLQLYRHSTIEKGENLVSHDLAKELIEGGNYDIVDPLAATPEQQDAVHRSGLWLTRDTVQDFQRATVTLGGDAFALAAGKARWTVGATFEDQDWRNTYDYYDSTGASHDNTDVLGGGGVPSAGERQRMSGHASMTIPLHARWDLSLGARKDDHDDVGSATSLHAFSRFRLRERLSFHASWDQSELAPGLDYLHLGESHVYPSICDPANQPVCRQEEMVTAGNPDLRPYRIQRTQLGAETKMGGVSIGANWIQVKGTDLLGWANPQVVVDRAYAGNPVPGTEVTRHGNQIESIVNPILQEATSSSEGVALRAGRAWDTDWGQLALHAHAFRTLRSKTWMLGELEPGDYPRYRFHTVLEASRGKFTARWNGYALSGYWNQNRTERYGGWMGHDITLQWRGAFGMRQRLDFTGGVLNLTGEKPEALPTADAVIGRQFFLKVTLSW